MSNKYVFQGFNIQSLPDGTLINYNIISLVKIGPGAKGTVVVEWNDVWTDVEGNPPEFLFTGTLFGTPENLVGTGGYSGLMTLSDNGDGTWGSIFQQFQIFDVSQGQAFYQQGKLVPWDGQKLDL